LSLFHVGVSFCGMRDACFSGLFWSRVYIFLHLFAVTWLTLCKLFFIWQMKTGAAVIFLVFATDYYW